MPNWTVYNFECEDVRARESLMDWFEENHPVEFPDDEDSIFAEVDNDDQATGADFAWIDRYLYVTVMGEAEHVVLDTTDRWERAAIASFDSQTETATEVTFIVDTDVGEDDEMAAVRFEGVEGYGGNDVMYALAMEHQFRFRSYAAKSPTSQVTPHPAAFDYVTAVESFVEDLRDVTGVEPSDAGLEFVRNDPGASHERNTSGTDEGGLDRATVVDTETGEVSTYDSADEVPEDGDDTGLLGRIRSLLG